MRNREAVRTRYPNAWALQSAQLDYQWVVMRGTTPDMHIGIGETPQKAWASAVKTLGFAAGIRKWHADRVNEIGTSQNTGSIPASRQAADTRPEGLADIGNGGDVKEGSGRSVTSAPMCRSERPSPDPVTAFEEYWGASKYRSRNMIGYSEKKCLAWEAYSAALQSLSPSIESEIERLSGAERL